MCKGVIDETLSNFAGVYAGNSSYDSVQDFVDKSDLVLSIGAVRSDFNTTGTLRLCILIALHIISHCICRIHLPHFGEVINRHWNRSGPYWLC